MLYAIGDLHGRHDLVTSLYPKILEHINTTNDPAGAQIIFMGDFIDRGPHSKQVLDFLMGLQDTDQIKHVCIMGNHEELMVQSYNGDKTAYRIWTSNGGDRTLASFDIHVPYYISGMNRALRPYVEWIETLPFYYETENYVFCHSGYFRYDFSIPLSVQRDSLLWGHVRTGYYKNYSKCVVHGHDPTWDEPEVDINRINVDTAGWYHTRNHMVAVVLPHGPFDASSVFYLRTEL